MREFSAVISRSAALCLFKDLDFKSIDLDFFICRDRVRGNGLLKWHVFFYSEGYKLYKKERVVSYPFNDVYIWYI